MLRGACFRGGVPWGWTLANVLVFSKVRRALGLDRCRFCMTAAAPIMRDTLDFFMSLDLPLMEIYGMSETTGTLNVRTATYMPIWTLREWWYVDSTHR